MVLGGKEYAATAVDLARVTIGECRVIKRETGMTIAQWRERFLAFDEDPDVTPRWCSSCGPGPVSRSTGRRSTVFHSPSLWPGSPLSPTNRRPTTTLPLMVTSPSICNAGSSVGRQGCMILAKFNVGTAFLQIVASVENIHKTIAAQVAKIQDIQIDVTPNMAGFAEAVAAESARLGDIEIDVTPNVAGFREKVAAATASISDATVDVKPDTTGFKEKVKAEIRGIGSMDVPITVDTTRANAQVGAFATSLRAKLEAATTALGDIHMTADSSDVDRKITAIRAQLVTLTNQRIGVDIDAVAALAKIKALETELAALGAKSPNIQVKVDVAKATAELAAFQSVVKGLGSDAQGASFILFGYRRGGVGYRPGGGAGCGCVGGDASGDRWCWCPGGGVGGGVLRCR